MKEEIQKHNRTERCVKCDWPLSSHASCCEDVEVLRCNNARCTYEVVIFKGAEYTPGPKARKLKRMVNDGK